MTTARSTHRSDPTRIGQVRPSHLVTTSGVGAVVDLPAMSVVVRGLDAWSAERQDVILEPRLLEEVRRVVGDSVRTLRSAPWDPQASDDPWTRVGVPVTPFPGTRRGGAVVRSDEQRLHDIVEAAAKVATLVARGRAAVDGDEFLQLALLKLVEVIGEASARISQELATAHPESRNRTWRS